MNKKISRWQKLGFWFFKNFYGMRILKVKKYQIEFRFAQGESDFLGIIIREFELDKPHYKIYIDANPIGIPSDVYERIDKNWCNNKCKELLQECRNGEIIKKGDDYAWLKGKNITKVDWRGDCEYEDVTNIDNYLNRIWEKENEDN